MADGQGGVVKRRHWREPMPKGVRQCQSRGKMLALYHVRLYVGPKKTVPPMNFGTYRNAREAGRVAAKARKMKDAGVCPWEILTTMIREGDVEARTRSTFYRLVPGGWSVKARNGTREVILPGPYNTAREASKAVKEALRSAPPDAR